MNLDINQGPKSGASPQINQQNHTPPGGTNGSRVKVWYMVFGILILVIFASGIWGLKEYRANKNAQKELNALKQNKSVLGESEVKNLIEQVGKLIILPQGEQPTIATVTDLEKLKGQAFFSNAQVGDKVLIYSTAKKAVLYRPEQNKIVEVAPLNLGTDTAANNATTTN